MFFFPTSENDDWPILLFSFFFFFVFSPQSFGFLIYFWEMGRFGDPFYFFQSWVSFNLRFFIVCCLEDKRFVLVVPFGSSVLNFWCGFVLGWKMSRFGDALLIFLSWVHFVFS